MYCNKTMLKCDSKHLWVITSCMTLCLLSISWPASYCSFSDFFDLANKSLCNMSQVPMSFASFFFFFLFCLDVFFCLDAFLLILKLWFWGGYVYVSFANIWEMSVPFLNYCMNLKLLWKSLSNNNNSRNSPTCPVVSTWCFHCWGPWFNFWSDR